ncbi:MAG: hypothetical protein ACRCVX_02335 [Shewanella sp.]
MQQIRERGRPPLERGVAKDADHKVFVTSPEKMIVNLMPKLLGRSGSDFIHESFVKSLKQVISENPHIRIAIEEELLKEGLELPIYLRG